MSSNEISTPAVTPTKASRTKGGKSKKTKSTVKARPAASCDGVVLRTPLLPVDTMVQWAHGTSAAQTWAEDGDVEAALLRDRSMLRERLASTVRRPEVREALYLAAPAVAEGIESWESDPTTKQGRDLERSLTRYATRMCTRATPFGLFSGCSVGTVGERTVAELDATTRYRRSVDLDADAIGAMATRLLEQPGGWARSRLFTNTTLFDVDGGFHYAEWRDGSSGRSYDLARVPRTAPLRAVLERAQDGATVDALVETLQQHVPDLEPAEALAFLDELVSSKLLTSELEPAVTGASPTEGFAAALEASHPEHASALSTARALLDSLNAQPLGAAPREYVRIRASLGPLLDEEHRHWLHGKLYKRANQLTVGPDVTDQIEAVTARLERLAPPQRPVGDFARRFEARYEGRFVPLLEALDPDAGIGFGSAGRDATPLLDGLPLGRPRSTHKTLSALEQRLAALVTGHAGQDSIELELDDPTLDRLTDGIARATDPGGTQASSVMFAVADPPEAGQPPELVFTASAGPSGVALLGRFCHSEPAIEDLVRRNIAAEEAEANVIYAEIAHTPEGRHANVIARPVLRGYEIPYLGRSGAPPDRQIRVSDLDVGVRHGRVVLRSRRLGAEIVPRLSSAHSASTSSLPVYRFLAAISGQDAGPRAGWNWGHVLPTLFDFLPRVRIAGAVVSKAIWSCRREEVQGLQSPDPAKRFGAMQTLRRRRGLPRWVSHGFADRLVVIDLDNSLSIDALAHAVRNADRFELTEVYPEPSRCLARGPEGRFVGEMIAPMIRRASAPRPSRVTSTEAPSIARSFPPGSEWLYARLYSSCAGVDRLIQRVVEPVLRAAEHAGAIDQWFFIRYGDPDWHVRLRAHGDPDRLQRVVLPALRAALEREQAGISCWKMELGTYEREVERYGGAHGIELAEAIFHRDSAHAARCLTAVGRDASLRWQATLAGIDATLDAMGLSLEQRLEVVTLSCTSMGPEFSLGKVTDKELSKRFREHRPLIEGILGPDPASSLGPDIATSLEVLRTTIRPVGEEYRRREGSASLNERLTTIAASVIHMHANRMLRSDARPQEYVLYDFLRRHYRSAIGRARKRAR